jgi:hypothetical protein
LDRNEEEDFLALKLPCSYPNSSKKQFKKFSILWILIKKASKEAKRFCKEPKRTSHLPELKNKNHMIYVGEDHTPSALHDLRQEVLSKDAASGQKACVALMTEEGRFQKKSLKRSQKVLQGTKKDQSFAGTQEQQLHDLRWRRPHFKCPPSAARSPIQRCGLWTKSMCCIDGRGRRTRLDERMRSRRKDAAFFVDGSTQKDSCFEG